MWTSIEKGRETRPRCRSKRGLKLSPTPAAGPQCIQFPFLLQSCIHIVAVSGRARCPDGIPDRSFGALSRPVASAVVLQLCIFDFCGAEGMRFGLFFGDRFKLLLAGIGWKITWDLSESFLHLRYQRNRTNRDEQWEHSTERLLGEEGYGSSGYELALSMACLMEPLAFASLHLVTSVFPRAHFTCVILCWPFGNIRHGFTKRSCIALRSSSIVILSSKVIYPILVYIAIEFIFRVIEWFLCELWKVLK
jgi:hypothetical protein